MLSVISIQIWSWDWQNHEEWSKEQTPSLAQLNEEARAVDWCQCTSTGWWEYDLNETREGKLGENNFTVMAHSALVYYEAHHNDQPTVVINLKLRGIPCTVPVLGKQKKHKGTDNMRQLVDLEDFKSEIKTYLFRQSYPEWQSVECFCSVSRNLSVMKSLRIVFKSLKMNITTMNILH